MVVVFDYRHQRNSYTDFCENALCSTQLYRSPIDYHAATSLPRRLHMSASARTIASLVSFWQLHRVLPAGIGVMLATAAHSASPMSACSQ